MAGIAQGALPDPLADEDRDTLRYIYDVFGDTVNIASRLESASDPMAINVSGATRALLGDAFRCEARGALPVKGAAPMEMFWVLG